MGKNSNAGIVRNLMMVTQLGDQCSGPGDFVHRRGDPLEGAGSRNRDSRMPGFGHYGRGQERLCSCEKIIDKNEGEEG